MAELRVEKYVSNLPGVLEANTLYFVRTGTGFDLYVTNNIGTIVAYPLNASGGGPSGNYDGGSASTISVPEFSLDGGTA